MNYEDFRDLWRQAMSNARLIVGPILPTENLDLRSGDRSYRVFLHGNLNSTERRLFHTTIELSWNWDALLTARFATTEEDLLTELFGRKRRPKNTEPPLLRVDVSLYASVPGDGFYPVPNGTFWRRWAAEVDAAVSPYYYKEVDQENNDEYKFPVVHSWTGEPEVNLHCSRGGQLYLSSVKLSAWQLVKLPRQWDDPARPREDEPLAELVEFLGRVREAHEAWEESLRFLLET